MIYNYAKALFEVAEEDNIGETVKNELEEICYVLEENPGIIPLLDCPGIDIKERHKIIAEGFQGAHQYILNLLYILAEKRRMYLFFSLTDEYKKACGIRHVSAVSAVPMTENEINRLKIILQKKHNKKIELENVVDPSILGGIILNFPDSQTDASLKRRLEKARNDLHKEKKYGY